MYFSTLRFSVPFCRVFEKKFLKCKDFEMSMKLILASASPRRQQLLREMDVAFAVQPADIDEQVRNGELPLAYVQRMASEKSAVIAAQNAQTAVLAADTVVLSGENIFGKPRDKQHAIAMWSALSGTKHQVATALSLRFADAEQHKVVSTWVKFKPLQLADMEQYWASGEPQDKAGGYAIQGLASAWVEAIDGSYSNVVGLPLYETNALLASINQHWL